MFEIRKLREEDLPSVCTFPEREIELYYAFPRASFPLEVDPLREMIRQRFCSSVLMHQERVIAFANLYDREGDECWFGNLMVHGEFRRMGAASFLLEAMTGEAREVYGIRKLKVACWEENREGISFYRRMGFSCFDSKKITKFRREINVFLQEKIL